MNTDLHTIWIWHSYFAKLSSEFENGMERFFVTMAFFLQRQQSVEDRVHLDITAWWGAAEPSLALQGVITHPGVWHNVWSAQKVFTVRLLPPTTQIALQVSLIAPTHLFREISFKGLTDALIADLSLDHESLPMDKSMTLAKTYNFFMIQFFCLNVKKRSITCIT